MDAASAILGLLTSCATISKCLKTVVELWDLRGPHRYNKISLQGLEPKIETMRTALETLLLWLQSENASKELTLSSTALRALHSTLKACSAVLMCIETDINDAVRSEQGVGLIDKLRLIWGADTIDRHVRSLDSQVMALTLLISAFAL